MHTIKIDINFLDEPLYFQKPKRCKMAFVWEDIYGYIYKSSDGLPDYVDMLILLYLMLKSQKAGYQSEMILSRYEILKNCGFNVGAKHYKRLEESLKIWQSVRIEFKGTFYDKQEYKSFLFGIIETASIRKNDLQVYIKFNTEWLLKIKESNYFKYLNFEYYKALKRPMSRRLYEILSPKCYDGKEWHIHLTKLGNKIPISKRTVQTPDGEKEVVYASDVLSAIKPGINEINRLAKDKNIADKAKVLAGDIFTVDYRITGKNQERIIHIKTTKVEPAKPAEPATASQAKTELAQAEPKPSLSSPSTAPSQPSSPAMQSLFAQCVAWVEGIPGFHAERKQEIYAMPMDQVTKSYPEIRQKYEAMTKKNKQPNPGWVYSAFTKNYEFAETVKAAEKKQAAKKLQMEMEQRIAEEARERQALLELKAHQERFIGLVDKLDSDTKQMLWARAQSQAPKNLPGNMHVPIEYAKLLLSHLREAGHDLPDKTVSSLEIVKQVMPRF